MYDDPSSILEIPETASIEEIHAAFRKKARQHHPDMGGDRQKFQELNSAYETLLKRKAAKASRSMASPDLAKSQQTKTTPTSSQPSSTSTFQMPPKPKSQRKKKTSAQNSDVRHLLTGKLPLQDQTTYFVLVNTLDIYLTYLHLASGNVESNPIANFFFKNWNIWGMVVFKMAIVAAVCVIAQIVALKSLKKASRLLGFGIVFVGCVVVYSVWLLAR